MPIPSSPPPVLPSRPMSRLTSSSGTPIPVQSTSQPIDNVMSSADGNGDKDKYLKLLDNVSVEIPEFLHELSTSKLDHLLERNDILRGHLLTNPNFRELKNDIIPLLEEQKARIEELKKFYSNDMGELVNKTDLELKKASDLLKSWGSLQVEMYAELERYQKPAILDQLQRKISSHDAKCSEIVNKFVNSKVDPASGGLVDSDHDEEIKIKKFIKDYRAQRQVYYMTKERYYRVNEDRVGGII